MNDSPLIPTYVPATEAEDMAFLAIVQAQTITDHACLKAIEVRAEQRACSTALACDKTMADTDIADFENISDPQLQRFAAVQILDNAHAYPGYSAGLTALGERLPALNAKLLALSAVDVDLGRAKEDRKTMDVALMTAIAASALHGARVDHASAENGLEYCGPAVAVSDYLVLQKTSRDGFTLHCLSDLDQLPVKDHQLSIKYAKGIGMVVDQNLQRAQQLAGGVGR